MTIRELADIVSDLIDDTEIVHTPGRNGDFGGAVISNERAARGARLARLHPAARGRPPLPRLARARPRAGSGACPSREPVEPPAARARCRRDRELPGWPSSPGSDLAQRLDRGARLPVAGTLIPSLLASRTDDFGTGQVGYVAITCLIAILAALCVLPLGPSGRPARGGVFAGWLVAGYVVLETLPWTRNILNLGMPHKGTIALCAMGLAIALVVAAAAIRWRDDEEAATDTVA